MMAHHTARRAALLVLVAMLALVTSCTAFMPASAGDQTAARPYSTVADLARALRAQQLADATMAYRLTLVGGSNPTLDTVHGTAAIRMSAGGTDSSLTLAQAEGDVNVIVIGQRAYGRDSSPNDNRNQWRAYPLASLFGAQDSGATTLLLVNDLWFTQLDGSSDAFTLSGASQVLGATAGATEYRMHADLVNAENLARRHAGLPELQGRTATVLRQSTAELDLTLDPHDRLTAAHEELAGNGQTITFDYTFADWGKPVDITAPIAG